MSFSNRFIPNALPLTIPALGVPLSASIRFDRFELLQQLTAPWHGHIYYE